MPSQSISLRKLCRIASGRTARSCGGAINLCNRCSNIRVRLEQGIPVSDEVIFLGPLKRIKDRQNCPLCRLIVESLPSSDTKTDKGDVQCTLNPRQDCGETFALFYGNSTNTALKAWIRIECPPGILDGFSSSPSPVQSLASPCLDEIAKKTLTIDVQKVRSWIQECEKQHGAQCDGHELSPETRTTKEMLLIDVVEDKLVDGNQNSRYIALSYVWGDWGGAIVSLGSLTSSDFLRTKGAFRSPRLRLPNVLRDAMSFTQSIGERYLWCDAICVFQDSMMQKEQQIAQMDVIYRQALLTIIALTGQHGDQSLPGIRQGSRLPTISVSEADGGVRFIARAPSVTVLAARSIYESRAWTFQEKLLSRRCLFMTEYQAFFCCTLKCFREDEDILDYPNQRTERFKLYSYNAGLAAMLNNSDAFGLYSNLVKDYTNRNLTNSWDILNAFKGISKALEGPFGDSFIKGLPRSHLHDALLWTPQSSIQKRSVLRITSNASWIPSWSWAAYTGQICYNWPNSTDLMGGRETPYKIRPTVSELLFIEFDLSFQGLKSPNCVSQYPRDGREARSTGSRLFLIHFVQFVCFLLRRLEEYFFEHVTELKYFRNLAVGDFTERWNQAKPRIKEFLDSHAWVFAKSPFPYMPSLDEFGYALERYKACGGSASAGYNATLTDLDFWPFYCNNDDRQHHSNTTSPCTKCELQESLWDKWATWPFSYVPSLAILQERLRERPINRPSIRGLCFWAHILPFDQGNIRGGQLFRNSFSTSSYFTTRDGTTQCNVATLSLATDLGVTPGQEIQPATVLWNAASEPCGIVLENEDTCISRISRRRCHLVLLSQCWFEEEELWHNYMIVAEATDGEALERIAVARIVPNRLRIKDITQTLRYIQLT